MGGEDGRSELNRFSWRLGLLYSFASVSGVFIVYQYFLSSVRPSMGAVVGAVVAANFMALLQTRSRFETGFVSDEALSDAILYGAAVYIGVTVVSAAGPLLGVEALGLGSAAAVLAASLVMIVRVVLKEASLRGGRR